MVPPEEPSPERIARHVKLYRDGFVSETLDAYRSEHDVPADADTRAASAVSLRQQGYSVEEIATTLKLSVARVRSALSG